MSDDSVDPSAFKREYLIPIIYISRDRMITFAKAFDPQPFHIDDEAAKRTLLGGLTASAWYTCTRISVCIENLAIEVGLDARLVGVEQVLLLAPVRADTQLSGRLRLSPIAPCLCGETACQGRVEVENELGEVVMRLTLDLILRQPTNTDAAGSNACRLRAPREFRAKRTPRDDVIRHFEDVCVGDEAILGTYVFDRNSVEIFNTLTCAEPQEQCQCAGVDLEAVPLWHLPAAWMACMLRYYQEEADRFAARGLVVPRLGPAAGLKHLRLVRPVEIGETIDFRGWAERKMEIRSQKDWGLLVVGAEGIDSQGNVVVSFFSQMLIERAESMH